MSALFECNKYITISGEYRARTTALYSDDIRALVVEQSLHHEDSRGRASKFVCERETLQRVIDRNHAIRAAVELAQSWERDALALIEPYERTQSAIELFRRREDGAEEALELARGEWESALEKAGAK